MFIEYALLEQVLQLCICCLVTACTLNGLLLMLDLVIYHVLPCFRLYLPLENLQGFSQDPVRAAAMIMARFHGGLDASGQVDR